MKMHRLSLTTRGSEIQELRDEVTLLRREIRDLVARLVSSPTPPRADWERWSLDGSLADYPTRLLTIVHPDASIADITIDQYEYVRAYDHQGRELPEHCGPRLLVEAVLRRRAPHVKWLPIQSRESGPVAAPETPIPEAREAIV